MPQCVFFSTDESLELSLLKLMMLLNWVIKNKTKVKIRFSFPDRSKQLYYSLLVSLLKKSQIDLVIRHYGIGSTVDTHVCNNSRATKSIGYFKRDYKPIRKPLVADITNVAPLRTFLCSRNRKWSSMFSSSLQKYFTTKISKMKGILVGQNYSKFLKDALCKRGGITCSASI